MSERISEPKKYSIEETEEIMKRLARELPDIDPPKSTKTSNRVVAELVSIGVLIVLFLLAYKPFTRAEIRESQAYEEGYEAGREDGYKAGHDDGYSEGYGEGYSEGESLGYDGGYGDGYSIGYDKGLEDAE